MKTSTLKQLWVATLVGIVFSIAINAISITKTGLVNSLPQILYVFVLMGGTFFLTGYISNSRGRDTRNMRIYAKKLDQKGKLKMDEQAELLNPGKKNIKSWLYLTEKSLILTTTKDPDLIEKTAIHMPFAKITKFDRFKPTAFTSDGIRIKMVNGNYYEFLVGHTDKWINAIEEKKQGKKF
ncbi:hypothetical protein [Peptostreptococcus equinus]|uniref:GRAM domain-containing protein n=1 Tax=Peptostreptococcus equinus TaxID=3003601 RepID=A0ABY7JP76_9FIRM|nr:hypothetical protein [Peptostreptococcus sp. CBA3647]WAW14974.1 hypothetical protein O0R46_00515 [Peptostreptococcus sp. CBA3647]